MLATLNVDYGLQVHVATCVLTHWSRHLLIVNVGSLNLATQAERHCCTWSMRKVHVFNKIKQLRHLASFPISTTHAAFFTHIVGLFYCVKIKLVSRNWGRGYDLQQQHCCTNFVINIPSGKVHSCSAVETESWLAMQYHHQEPVSCVKSRAASHIFQGFFFP
jgi:hypothetical protein